MTDTTAINKTYFNKVASEYEQKHGDALRQLEDDLRGARENLGIPERGRLLDYACGTGLLTRALGSPMSQCVGLDVSESMVEIYNVKAENEGHSSESRKAYLGNLLDPADPAPPALSGPEFTDFDVVGTSMALHHVDDCDLAVRRLAERLRPGGVLVIADWLSHDDGKESSHGVRHAGFAKDQVRAMFEGAGVGKDFVLLEAEHEMVLRGSHSAHGDNHNHSHGHGHGHGHQEEHGGHGSQERRRKVFFARGTKA